MGKVTHIGKDTNIASLYSVKQVLDDVLCDLEKGEQYNKAMILLLGDRDGKYIVQPF